MNPVDRFGHLPEATRRWLESLREEDINELREAIKLSRNAKTVGSFSKWLALTIFGTIVSVITFGEKLMIGWKWITGAPK